MPLFIPRLLPRPTSQSDSTVKEKTGIIPGLKNSGKINSFL